MDIVIIMIDFIRRKKNIKKLSRYFKICEKYNIIIDNFCLCPIHEIPNKFGKNDENYSEVDYYLNTGYDVYLLRLHNSDKNTITFVPFEKKNSVIYIIVQRKFDSKNFYGQLKEVIERIKEAGIPKKLKKEIKISYY